MVLLFATCVGILECFFSRIPSCSPSDIHMALGETFIWCFCSILREEYKGLAQGPNRQFRRGPANSANFHSQARRPGPLSRAAAVVLAVQRGPRSAPGDSERLCFWWHVKVARRQPRQRPYSLIFHDLVDAHPSTQDQSRRPCIPPTIRLGLTDIWELLTRGARFPAKAASLPAGRQASYVEIQN